LPLPAGAARCTRGAPMHSTCEAAEACSQKQQQEQEQQQEGRFGSGGRASFSRWWSVISSSRGTHLRA
jgi:hypothetical protein